MGEITYTWLKNEYDIHKTTEVYELSFDYIISAIENFYSRRLADWEVVRVQQALGSQDRIVSMMLKLVADVVDEMATKKELTVPEFKLTGVPEKIVAIEQRSKHPLSKKLTN